MYHRSVKVLFVIALLCAVSVVSCYKESLVSDSFPFEAEPPTILTVSPANGATGVDRYSGVMINSSGPMDTASVTANYYLYGGNEMQRWMDTMVCVNAIDDMGDADRDRLMLWMDSIKSSGHFVWSGNLDTCTFHPDSILVPNSEHLVFLTGHVRDYQGRERAMESLPLRGYMFHFRTGL